MTTITDGRDAPGGVESQIAKATGRAGKTYSFDEGHEAGRPADWWFQESHEGLILFAVFYTQACRWSLCTGCNLPSVSSCRHVGWHSIIEQVDTMLGDPAVRSRRRDITKVIVSNNGSVLDEETFSSTALMYLVVQLNLHLPRMKVLSIETRVEYVDMAELEFLSRAIKEREEPAEIELAIGFEAFDDGIRNEVFMKGLSLEAFEGLVRNISRPHFRLKCYLMQKPIVGMSDEDAIRDIQQGIDYLSELACKYGVAINMHLNPTFVARGTLLETAFRAGDYTPPMLLDVARAVMHGMGKNISIFVGLCDEGLAAQGGSFIRPGDEAVAGHLEAFNRTGDFSRLMEACCLGDH